MNSKLYIPANSADAPFTVATIAEARVGRARLEERLSRVFYLLPDLVKQAIERVPQMPLIIQENFTAKLLEMLRTGDLDAAIMAEPFPDTGLAVAPLYDEPFMAAVPKSHPLAKRKSLTAEELKNETMLLLGTGHCFRDHVLEVCPEFARFSNEAEGIRLAFRDGVLARLRDAQPPGANTALIVFVSHGCCRMIATIVIPSAKPHSGSCGSTAGAGRSRSPTASTPIG